jgi:4a-hydroxytetrahydrobiopterin dehydratase
VLLKGAELRSLQDRLGDGWRVVDGHHLEKEFGFRDFDEALAFVNLIGELANRENHHPDLRLSWGKVVASIHTHDVDGLTESDFVLAAKIDQLNG